MDRWRGTHTRDAWVADCKVIRKLEFVMAPTTVVVAHEPSKYKWLSVAASVQPAVAYWKSVMGVGVAQVYLIALELAGLQAPLVT